MKLRSFLIGMATGLAAAIIIKETAERVAPFIPANQVLNSVKSEFKKEAPIDGSWIYMKTEDFHNGVTTIPVYKGGISRVINGEMESFEFAADARSGVIVDLKRI
ncbi:hypothetical protein [Ureibacillus acetophenoni]|uniref:Predicted small secreted protein n=1 Tax=Ureibacillus acetophenoni TaxID=614649 RepID=A0A285U4L8_9BACL|nr:hypothetical protein [Ureibacillus acetophenoni]SOC36627.1 predicted small secreted protein [Ureibacillus acetophenoni]